MVNSEPGDENSVERDAYKYIVHQAWLWRRALVGLGLGERNGVELLSSLAGAQTRVNWLAPSFGGGMSVVHNRAGVYVLAFLRLCVCDDLLHSQVGGAHPLDQRVKLGRGDPTPTNPEDLLSQQDIRVT